MVWKIFSEKATMHDLEQLEERLFSEEYYGTLIDDITRIKAFNQEIHKRLTDCDKLCNRADELRISDIERLSSVIEHMGKVAVERTAQIQRCEEKIDRVVKAGSPAVLSELQGRIEALEVRLTQMHGMLTEENPVTGKKKLSPLGKRMQAFYKR